jgi:hypothetical protein
MSKKSKFVLLWIDAHFSNLQTLADAAQRTYTTRSECSIEFEVDGPYKVL